MNLDRLRAVQVEEREADSLRSLPDAFYREVADYIEELRKQRAEAAEAAADPFGADDVRRLTDEIETAEEVAEAIYERRVGKLVKRASLAAAGMPADEEGLTTEEAELFSDLVAQIEDHRAEVLASFDAEGRRSAHEPGEGKRSVREPGEDAPTRPEDDPVAERERVDGADEGGASDPELDAGEAMGGETKPAEPPGETPSSEPPETSADPPPPPDEPPGEPSGGPSDEHPGDAGPAVDDAGSTGESDPEESTDGGERERDTERVTLRITRDVGEVFGVDERVYDLASEDVVTIPEANAKPLLDRDAAEQID